MRFSRASARLRVMFTPRTIAALPSTTTISTMTPPIPMNAFITVCDTSTARDVPDPCGTSITVQRRSACLRIGTTIPRVQRDRVAAGWRRRYATSCDSANPGQGVGSGPEGTAIIRPTVEGVNTPQRDLSHEGLGLWEQDRWLRYAPPLDRQAREVGPTHLAKGLPCRERAPDGVGGPRDERQPQRREPRHGARQVREHRIELRILLLLRELPRRGLLDVAVGPRREPEERRRSLLDSVAVHRARIGGERVAAGLLERRGEAARVARHDALAVAMNHRERARHEVAERVGEVRGVARVEALPAEIAVALEPDFAQQEVAERVGAVPLDRPVEAHRCAGGLAHLRAGPLHVAVRPHGTRDRQLGGEQHRGPDHAMEARDAFADHVQVGGPQLLGASVGEPGRREIVDQRVEPDVHRLLRVAGEGNAPRLTLARDRDVLEPRLEQPHDLVAPDLGLHREGAGADALEHGVAIPAQPEEVIPLFGPNQLERRMLDAVAILDLALGLELLASGAVQPLVFSLEEIVRVPLPDALQQRRNGPHMARLGGADPVVVAAAQPVPVPLEGVGHAIHPRLRRHVVAGGGLDYRL